MRKISLKPSQLLSAELALETVRDLLEADLKLMHGVEAYERYVTCVYKLALSQVREARWQIGQAQMINPLGQVDAEALETLRPFRAIGMSRLRGFLEAKRRALKRANEAGSIS